MELDSVLVRVTSNEDLRRLARAGGEVWQEWRDGVQWEGALRRVPAAAALRLGLIALGAELAEVAEVAQQAPATPR